MRHIFYIVPIFIILIFVIDNSAFAKSDCLQYEAYPSYHQRCLLRMKRIERMDKAKEKRKETSRKYREPQKTKEQIQEAKEKAKKAKNKIEDAIAKKAKEEASLKNEEPKTHDELDALPEDAESEKYTPIVVDPTQISPEQLKQIKSILEKKEPNKPYKKTKPTIMKVPLPNVGLGKIEYIDIPPVTPSELYKK